MSRVKQDTEKRERGFKVLDEEGIALLKSYGPERHNAFIKKMKEEKIQSVLQRQPDDQKITKLSDLKKTDKGCQTNLDSINIEKLVEARLTLKRKNEELQANRRNQATQCDPIRQNQSPMCPDEKEILEMLFLLDGQMTTVYDKLKAISDNR